MLLIVMLQDGVLRDGLIDVYGNLHLGGCTDKIAKKYGVTREEQDEYAAQSYRRAAAAWEVSFAAHLSYLKKERIRGSSSFLIETVFKLEIFHQRVLNANRKVFYMRHQFPSSTILG